MLPIFISQMREFTMMQNRWSSEINPILRIPILSGLELKDIELINGTTTINHKLGREQQGWILLDVNAAATIYRSQPFNDKTLTLTSNAAVTVALWVY